MAVLFLQQGMFATAEEDFFVEPLWNQTEPNQQGAGQYHVVYKRSAIKSKYKETDCGVQGETRSMGLLIKFIPKLDT